MLTPSAAQAVRTIVNVLPFLKAEGNAIPKEHVSTVTAIRTDAARFSSGPRDVQLDAAERWAEDLLDKALSVDAYPGEHAPLDAPPETPAPAPEAIEESTIITP